MSSVPAITFGWFATIADRAPVEASEAGDDVHRPQREDLEELAVVDDAADHLVHVVRLLGAVRDEVGEPLVHPLGVVGGGVGRRILEVVRRQEATAGSAPASGRPRRPRRSNDATPDFVACVIAPPSSSNVTSSPVTVLITSGPVMNMCEVSFTMNVKSVIAGE